MKVVAATQNPHKIEEIRAITEPFGFLVVSRKEAGIADFEINEDGETFEENSLKKAMEIHLASGLPTIADDSGIMVDYLNGAPGVYSARFAGVEGDDEANNEKLLKLMAHVPREERGGKFVSAISMVFSQDDVIIVRGECKGRILYETRGENGFGYDPLFQPEGYDTSFGELSSSVKNEISHRAMALKALRERLKQRE